MQEFYKMSAIMVLMEYLTDTAVAPLQRDFVEVAEPFCSQVSSLVLIPLLINHQGVYFAKANFIRKILHH